MGELKWFILALIILWVLWVLSGGPAHYESKTNPFIEQPFEGGQVYDLDDLREKQRN